MLEVPRGGPHERGRRAQPLRIIRAKKSGKRFVGCEGYPDCDQTYGIPQRGDLIRLEEVCSICGKTPRAQGAERPPPLEPVPERGVPLDGGDARRARRARGRAGRQGGGGEAARGGGGRRPATAKSRRPSAKSGARPKPQDARRRRSPSCSSPSRASTAPARRPRPGCSPRRSATRRCWCASRAERRPRSGSASWSRTRHSSLSPITETLLFGAARAELVATVIRPALADGQDRDLRPLRRLDGRLPGRRARARDREGRGAQPLDHGRPRRRSDLPARRPPEPGEPRGRARRTGSRPRARRYSTRSPSPTRSSPRGTATATCGSTPRGRRRRSTRTSWATSSRGSGPLLAAEGNSWRNLLAQAADPQTVLTPDRLN